MCFYGKRSRYLKVQGVETELGKTDTNPDKKGKKKVTDGLLKGGAIEDKLNKEPSGAGDENQTGNDGRETEDDDEEEDSSSDDESFEEGETYESDDIDGSSYENDDEESDGDSDDDDYDYSSYDEYCDDSDSEYCTGVNI